MLAKNKIYCMDCFEFLDKITNNSIDLAIIDPPYNLKYYWEHYYYPYYIPICYNCLKKINNKLIIVDIEEMDTLRNKFLKNNKKLNINLITKRGEKK